MHFYTALSLRRIFKLCGITALGSLVFVSRPANAQLIVNGSFENPVAPANSFTTISAGSTALTGWTINQGSIDLIGSGFWQAYSGVQSIDLDGTGGAVSAGIISQSFATVIGKSYTATLEYANNPGASGSVGALISATDSSSRTLFSSSISHSGSTATTMNYTLFTDVFVADTTTTTLTIASTDAPTSQTGIALDSVNVTATAPEPGALILTVLGMAPAGYFLRNRFSRQS